MNAVRIYSKKAKVPLIPKFHIAQHLGHKARLVGNPKYVSEYLDESHNRLVVKLAQAASRADFSSRLLARERLLYDMLKKGSNLP